MQEIGEITEICNDELSQKKKKKENHEDDIEVGLKIVELEMGRILEELKDNLEQVSWNKSAEELSGKTDAAITKRRSAPELHSEESPNESNKTQNLTSASNSNKFQSKPLTKNKPHNSVSTANAATTKNTTKSKPHNSVSTANAATTKISQYQNSKQQVQKENSTTKPISQVEKKNYNGKRRLNLQKINNKPNYQVQKTNYHANCDKLASLHSNLRDSSITRHPSYSASNTSSNRNYTANKIRATQQNRSKVFGGIQKKIVPTTQMAHRSSISSTSSNFKTYSMGRVPHNNLNQIIRRQSSFCSKIQTGMNTVLKPLKDQVECAIQDRKTFTICGNYYSIRRALLSRGWVEKIRILYNTYDRDNLKRMQSCNTQELLQGIHDPQKGYVYKRMIMSKLLGQHQVDFYWDQNFDCFRVCRDNVKLTLVNRFRRGIFSYTSKQGLCESMKCAHWFQKAGFSTVRHPRSYNLSNSEDPKEFINDFKLSAAMSLLKWIVKNQENQRSNRITSDVGKVPLKVYHFAIAELSKAVRKCKHEDIDYEIEEAIDYQWNEFLESYYKIVHIGNRFKTDGKEKFNAILNGAKNMLKKIETFWPHLQMDGMLNIWILKPTNGSRGEGIYLCRTLQYILKIIKSNTTRRYIVQKYIERPLLIYNTKFDIRQWFLISSSVPLTIWIYKDCYIRFSSQLYNLRRLHESVHLTNNSVQSRYKNCKRNAALPECNMWDSNQFKKYLTSIGYPNVYMDVIYPGMKECITGAILMNQGNIDNRKNCFELYGSDFMLTEDFKPWLIEINSRPALYPSTAITARMCPEVLDDLIKVIIDYPKNPKASTGRFELMYKEEIQKLPTVEPNDLQLKGQKLPTSYFYTPDFSIDDNLTYTASAHNHVDCTHYNIKEISSEMKKTLENLLSLIQAERERRKKLRHQSSQVSNITETCTNKKLDPHKAEIHNRQQKEDSKQIITVATKISDSDAITLEVIKSVASNLKETESVISNMSNDKTEQHSAMEEFQPRRHMMVNNEIEESLKAPLIAKSDNPKSIFKNIIHSIRNLTFVCRSSQHT